MPAPLPIHSVFKPGDFARQSGIYKVSHLQHRAVHDVILLQGEEFPACRICRGRVAFRLVRPLHHATHDWDFAGPRLELVRRPQGSSPKRDR